MKKLKIINSFLVTLSLFFSMISPVFAVDSDSDGLEDWMEKVYGTNDSAQDTDGDSYSDKVEIDSGYNPVGPGKLSAEQLETFKKNVENILSQIAETGNVQGTQALSDTNTPQGETGESSVVETTTEDSALGITSSSGEEASSQVKVTDNTPAVLENVSEPETTPYSEVTLDQTAESGTTAGSEDTEVKVWFSQILDEDIRKVTPDKLGNLWMATKNGLLKLDFENFYYYTDKQGLPSNNIKDVSIAPDNTVWILTSDGVTKFDPSQELQSAYVFYNEENGLETKLGEKLHVGKDNKVWLGTDGEGVYVFDGKVWERLETDTDLKTARITSIIEDKSGNIWLASDNKGVFEITFTDKYSIKNYDTKAGIISNQIKDFVFDQEETLWIATDFGLSKYQNGKAENIETRGNISGSSISKIYVDKDGLVWIGTDTGINKYDSEAGTWNMIDSDLGFPTYPVNSIIEDAKKNLWIGGKNGLVSFSSTDLEEILSSGTGTEDGSEEEILVEPIDLNQSGIEEDLAAAENANTDIFGNIISMIQEKVELAKSGDMQSLLVLGGPVIVILLLLILVFIKEQQKKKLVENFENNSTQQAAEQTNKTSNIASIGTPPLQNFGTPIQPHPKPINPFPPMQQASGNFPPAPNPLAQQQVHFSPEPPKPSTNTNPLNMNTSPLPPFPQASTHLSPGQVPHPTNNNDGKSISEMLGQ